MHLLQHDPLTDELVELVELEDEGIGVHELSWSPDGTRVARVSSKQDRVSIVRVVTTTPEPQTFSRRCSRVRTRPGLLMRVWRRSNSFAAKRATTSAPIFEML